MPPARLGGRGLSSRRPDYPLTTIMDSLDLVCFVLLLTGFGFGLLGWLSLRYQIGMMPEPKRLP